MKVDVVLDLLALSALGSFVSGPRSASSPLATSEEATADAGRERLQSLGLLDSSGSISGSMRRTVGVLAASTAVARVAISGRARALEYDVWFDSDGGPPVCLTVSEDALQLTDPAPIDSIMDGLAQMIGESAVQSTDFEAEVEPACAVVLAAMMDDHRRTVLHALAESSSFSPSYLNEMALSAVVVSSPTGPFWITGVLTGGNGVSPQLDRRAVSDALASLIKAGHVRSDGEGYAPDGQALSLATRLLVVDQVITVGAGRETSAGEMEHVSFTCLQSGVHDLLWIERAGDVVKMEAVSAADVLLHIGAVLTTPLALHDEAAPTKRCACGDVLQPHDRFCRTCGTAAPG